MIRNWLKTTHDDEIMCNMIDQKTWLWKNRHDQKNKNPHSMSSSATIKTF
jgi:hypothetical protein